MTDPHGADEPPILEQYAAAAERMLADRRSGAALIERARAGAVRAGRCAAPPTLEQLAALVDVAPFLLERYRGGFAPIPATIRRRLERLAEAPE